MPNIIFIEDTYTSRKMIKNKLDALGVQGIREFTSSASAWEYIAHEILEGGKVDLVITDLNMPELDGMDLLRNIKNDHLSEHVPVFIISADSDEMVIEEAKKLGALEYFTKPIDIEKLKESIEKVVS